MFESLWNQKPTKEVWMCSLTKILLSLRQLGVDDVWWKGLIAADWWFPALFSSPWIQTGTTPQEVQVCWMYPDVHLVERRRKKPIGVMWACFWILWHDMFVIKFYPSPRLNCTSPCLKCRGKNTFRQNGNWFLQGPTSFQTAFRRGIFLKQEHGYENSSCFCLRLLWETVIHVRKHMLTEN